jgi:hypothetical protein
VPTALIRKSKPRSSSLFGLAPCGVCPARCITAAAVRSYRTFSPLPWRCHQAVCFLWHFPSSRLEPAVPDVIRHTALRSSDFPLPAPESAESDRPVRLPTRFILYERKSGLQRRASDITLQTPRSPRLRSLPTMRQRQIRCKLIARQAASGSQSQVWKPPEVRRPTPEVRKPNQ